MMKYQYWLANIEGIYTLKIHTLLSNVENAKELYEMPKQQVCKLEGLTEADIKRILDSKRTWDLSGKYEAFARKNIQFITLENPDYPQKLRELYDAPYALYYKGRLPDTFQYAVGIVGARMCSDYGRALTHKIAGLLGHHGIQVISGMARGIDSYGHAGAIQAGGNTFAVLGCGVDICYPKSNWELYEKIQQNGGIISEYPPGTQPYPQFFPQRNRLISAFCDTLVVVEAKKRSGSLITADCALEQGKDIYAVPGRIDDPLSAGCNGLIKQGAGILLSPEDLIYELQLEGKMEQGEYGKKKKTLEKEELLVYSCFDLHAKNVETIQKECKMELTRLLEILFELEDKGYIEETFKNYYRKKL